MDDKICALNYLLKQPIELMNRVRLLDKQLITRASPSARQKIE